MRKIFLLLFISFITLGAFSQDFSNKGKDFWVGYGNHERMFNGGQAETMEIYLTSDVSTTGNISIASVGFNQNFSITANQLTVITIPRTAALLNEGLYNHGIHITAVKPIVAYGFIYVNAVSGATVFLPTNTLGKEYYSLNYTQVSNVANSYSYFFVEAVEPGTTIVQITPSQTTKGGWPANVMQTVTLTQGQIYQVLSATDLTGSIIKTVTSGSGGCKKIAVFCGSGKIGIGGTGGGSADNLYQQMYPSSTWGKKYVLIPSENRPNTTLSINTNFFRIYRPDPATVVTLNGAVIPAASFTNNYYQFTSNATNLVNADKPILVAQYFTTQGQSGNQAPHDPEMIYLNPVEQTITDVTVNSMQPAANTNISQHFINVVLRNAGTGISSFKIDGATPNATVTVLPQDNNYAYLRINYNGSTTTNLSSGAHHLTCDSGFNAIAYGFGGTESYGYSAGTNLKDLYQQIGVSTEYGIETTPSVCTNTPFRFKVSLPYCADSIRWNLSNLPGPPAAPATSIYTTCTPGVSGGPDSTSIVNGKTIYWYSLPSLYSFSSIGSYPVTITTFFPTAECGGTQDIDFDLTISSPPLPSYAVVTPGCYMERTEFIETTLQTPKPTYKWFWDFGDGNTSTSKNPSHTYAAPGTYITRYSSITTPGCLSDTISQTIVIPDVPSATISGTTTVCINSGTPFITFAGTEGKAPYQFSYNINGGAAQTVSSTGTNASVTIPVSTTTSGTFVYTLDSVKNVGSTVCTKTITGQSATIIVNPDASIALTSAPATANQTLCINTPITDITYAIGGGGSSAGVIGLPPGVTGSYASGVFTITGTPTVSGTFNYTVLTTGICIQKTATGTITINPDAAIALTSSAGTEAQALCINTPLSNITYSVSGGGTGATITGLPAGVTGTYSGGVFTVLGTPTVTGTFNYTITTTGICIQKTATGSITVNPDAAIALTSAAATANQTLCINNAIANITYAVTGGGTGAVITGLPAGVSGIYAAGNVLISGTPTVSGTFNYTVTTTGTCIQKTANGTITVNPDADITLTSAPATTNQSLCINTNISTISYNVTGGASGATITGLPAGVTGTYSAGTFTINGAPSVTGTFNYTINTTGICIQKTATGTIIVNPDAAIALTSAPATSNQTVCINTGITTITYAVTGGGTGATITGLPAGVTGTYTAGTVTITGIPTVTGSFNYTVTTTGTCIQKTATGSVIVNPDAAIALTSALSTTNQELCATSSITAISYSVTGGGTGATVSGLPAGVSGSYSGGVFTITGAPTVSGVYNYTVTTTGICVQKTATGTITVDALPTPNFTYTIPSCETRVITFTDASTANTGVLNNWQWTFGDATTGTGTPVTKIYTAAGTYTVTLTVTTDKGCVSNPIASKTVVINDRPLAGYIIPEVCLSDTYAQFTDTSKVNNGNITAWAWNFGDPNATVPNPNTSLVQNPQHSYTAVGTYPVQLIATSNTGCKDTVTQNLVINGSFPTANFTVNNPATLCANDSVAIVNTSSVFPGTITKVEIYWDNVNAPGVFQLDDFPYSGKVYRHLYPNFQSPLTKTFTIRFRAYSGGVCVNDKISTITVNAAPKVQFNNMPDACYDAVPFQITQASEIGGVPGSGVYTGAGVSPTGIFNPAAAGIGLHFIKYTYTSTAAGCVDTITRAIKVLDTASAKFSFITPTCEGSTTTFKDESVAPAGVTLNNIVCDFGDGSPLANYTPGSTFAHTYATAGTYTVKMYTTSAYGCKSTIRSRQITISPIPNTAFAFKESSVCIPNASVSFINNSTIADGSEAGFLYLWNFGDITSGPLNTSLAKTPPAHLYSGTGPYTVTLTVTSDSGCVKTASKPVDFIHPQPVTSFTMSKPGVCLGDPVTFTDISNGLDGTVTQWYWDFGDGVKAGTSSVSYLYKDTLVYNLSLYIINSHGCSSDPVTQPFTVYPYPAFDAGPDQVVLEGGSTTLAPNIIRGTSLQYLWTPATYLNDNTVERPIASNMLDDITYTLQVTGRGGCVAPTDKVFIKILKAPQVPNTFTPNGDGINELWKIEYLDTYPNCKVQVFTRNGQQVFESRGYKTPWDGTIKGKALPFDTYYYIIEPGNGRKPITGYVTIMK